MPIGYIKFNFREIITKYFLCSTSSYISNFKQIKQCPNSRKLKLENNNISDIKTLNNLLGLNIKKIYLSGNPFIKDNPDYKEKLFNIFLSLISIDYYDKEGNDIESTEYGDQQNLFEIIKNNDKNNNESDDGNNEIEYDPDELDILDNEEEEEEEDDDDEDNDNLDNKNDEKALNENDSENNN